MPSSASTTQWTNEFRWGQRRFISEGKYRQLSREHGSCRRRAHHDHHCTCGRCAIRARRLPFPELSTRSTFAVITSSTGRSASRCSSTRTSFSTRSLARYLARKAKGAINGGTEYGSHSRHAYPSGCRLTSRKSFAEIVKAVGSMKRVQRQATAEVQALLASLQHRAFRGEL